MIKIIRKIPLSLGIILLIALFLRVYKLEALFPFGHEQDLQAWIVKDVLVDKHLRLIGQETSIHGVFIGPLFYYLLVPFYLIFNFNPLAGYIPITIISLLTVISIFYVTDKLYERKTATIASLIYAVSPTIIFLDRWIVPTQLTLLWTIWFFYVLSKFSRGSLKEIPILFILTGLIWHVHVALLPLLLLLAIAFYLSKKDFKKEFLKVDKKLLKISIIVLIFLIIPFALFELRHNFQQTKAIFNINKVSPMEGIELRTRVFKIEVIVEYINRVIWQTLFYGVNPKFPMIWKIPLLLIFFMSLIMLLYHVKKIQRNEMLLFFLWLIDVFASQYFSKHLIADYYFNNLIILSLIVFSLLVTHFVSKKLIELSVLLLLWIYFIYGTKTVVTMPQLVGEYVDKSSITEFIGKDFKSHNYSCAAINYIGDIPVRYGYRFLFWKNGVKEITPGNDLPVYSIVQPYTISEKEISYKSGNIGVILPKNTNSPSQNLCDTIDRQLIPLNGFVK